VYRLGNDEEREKRRKWWYKIRRDAGKKMLDEMNRRTLKVFRLPAMVEEKTEERNDVYIYKTLRCPPKSTPPTTN
jgi:hypothetical protein